MDYGFHPPTIYFPLIVPEALMIEPTETETKETLDAFCDAMLAIAREAAEEPELLKEAPHDRPVRRLDEVRAAKQPVVKYGFEEHPQADAEPAPARPGSRRAASDLRRGGELAAGGLDVPAARQAHGDGDARALELAPEGARSARATSLVQPRSGCTGCRLTLKWSRPRSAASARACSGESFTPASITYSTKTRRFVAARVPAALGDDVRDRVALVHRHDPRPQLVVRRVEREREPDRLVHLVDEALQAGQPADRRDRRPPVRDPEVRQPPRRAEHLVEVEHRLAHPHEDGVVHLGQPPEVERLVEDLRGGEVAAERHRAVAQNVHVSGQPDCEERQSERRPSR